MKKEVKIGIKQAVLIALYITLVSQIMQNGEKVFGKMDNFIGPAAFLTMFASSALICTLLVFKKPYELFYEGKKKEAVDVVVYTAVSLISILAILFGVMLL